MEALAPVGPESPKSKVQRLREGVEAARARARVGLDRVAGHRATLDFAAGLEWLLARARTRVRADLDFHARLGPSVLWPPTILLGALAALGVAGFTVARWAGPLVGLALAGAVWACGRVDGAKPGGWLWRLVGYPAAAWLTLIWVLGFLGGLGPLLGAGLWAWATVLWLVHGRGWRGEALVSPRQPDGVGRVEEVLHPAHWTGFAERLGLSGVVVRRVRRDGDETVVSLALGETRLMRDVADRLERLDALLHLREGAVSVRRGPETGAHLCELRIVPRDPWSAWRDYPGPSSETFRDPVRVAYRATGETVAVSLHDQDAMISGKKGSGKSRFMGIWIVELAARRDVLLFGMDVAKVGVEFKPMHPLFWRLATTPEEAAEMVRELTRIREIRAAWQAEQGLTEWPVSPERPQIVVIMDELSILLEQGKVRDRWSQEPSMSDLLDRLSMAGRQAGISLVGGTQMLYRATMGDSLVLRRQAGVRCSMRVNEKADGVAIFGNDDVASGWRPDRMSKHPGMVLIQSDENPDPVELRAWRLPSTDLPPLVERLIPHRPRLEESTTVALRGAPAASTPREPSPDERLAALMARAGDEGLEAGEIVEEMKSWMVKATVYGRLKAGYEQVRHGRWRMASGEEE